MKPKKNKSKKNDIRISHKDLLAKIGEIDGISLESIGKNAVGVFLYIDGKKVELLRNHCSYEGMIDHHLTRIGIAETLCGRM